MRSLLPVLKGCFACRYVLLVVTVECDEQDFPLPANVIWNLWRSRKISDTVAIEDLTFCRDFKSVVALRTLRAVIQGERERTETRQVGEVLVALRSIEKPFLAHPIVQSFVDGFDPKFFGVRGRWKPVAFLGDSDSGKSWKAMSLFPGRTLKVSCNGLGFGLLPSLQSFDRSKHSAICFDEIRADQVLGNRELFQSGPYPCKLGQSACAQHEYTIWLYSIALILCSNNLDVNPKAETYESDAKWMDHNVIPVVLRPGQKWYRD